MLTQEWAFAQNTTVVQNVLIGIITIKCNLVRCKIAQLSIMVQLLTYCRDISIYIPRVGGRGTCGDRLYTFAIKITILWLEICERSNFRPWRFQSCSTHNNIC